MIMPIRSRGAMWRPSHPGHGSYSPLDKAFMLKPAATMFGRVNLHASFQWTEYPPSPSYQTLDQPSEVCARLTNMLIGWYTTGWFWSAVSIALRSSLSNHASSVASRVVVDHLSFALLLLKPLAKAVFAGRALKTSHMSHCRCTTRNMPMGKMPKALLRTHDGGEPAFLQALPEGQSFVEGPYYQHQPRVDVESQMLLAEVSD
jgi:hypothetical protein